MAARRESTEVRQKQITDAARKLIIRHGSEHITVRLIAQQIGITEAAVYRHFKSKREILVVLVDDIRIDWTRDLEEATFQQDSIVGKLHSILISRISAAEQKGGISFLIIAEILSLGDKALNKHVSEFVESYVRQLAKLVTEGVRLGELDKEIDPLSTATILYGTIQGLVNLWALNNREFVLIDSFEKCWKTLEKTMFRMNREVAKNEHIKV